MKLLIAGSRSIVSYRKVFHGICKGLWHWNLSTTDITEEVSGHAQGVDLLGESWALEHDIPIKTFPAKWREFGHYDHAAGYKRNLQMAEYLATSKDSLALILWDGRSKGSKNMYEIALAKKIETLVLTL